MKKKSIWMGVGFVVALALGLWWQRQPIPALTGADLVAARQKWAAQGPSDYRFEVRVSGVQTGLNRITVRNKKVVAMTSEGSPVRKSAWPYWTMEGMFGFMEEEVAICESRANNETFLHARFDPTLGYPTYFLRQVFGAQQTIEWHIDKFQAEKPEDPVPPSPQP